MRILPLLNLLLIQFTLLIGLSSIVALPVNDRIRIIATIEPLALIARDIGGDLVEVATIVPAFIDPHVYAPKPKDRLLLENADIFVCVGREEFLGYFEDVQAIKLGWENWSSSMYIPGGNPHYVWLYPSNAIVIARALYMTLSIIDPWREEYYRYRFEQFNKSISAISGWIKNCKSLYRLDGLKVALAGSHMEPLLDYMGIEIAGILVRGERTVAPRDITEFRELARSADAIIVHLLEYELDEGRIASEISKDVGVPIVVFNPLPTGYEDSYIEYIKIVSYGLIVSLANLKLGYFREGYHSMQYIPLLAAATFILILTITFRRYRGAS